MLATSEELGKTLQALRARRGLSQLEVAERVGIRRETLGHIERGENRPFVSTLGKLAAFYEVAFDDLNEGRVDVSELPASGSEDEEPEADLENAIEVEQLEVIDLPDSDHVLIRLRKDQADFLLAAVEDGKLALPKLWKGPARK